MLNMTPDYPLGIQERHIKLRQSKDLKNLVEQYHRAVKRRARPMMGFKSF